MVNLNALLICVSSFFVGAAAPIVAPSLVPPPCETGCQLEQSTSGSGCPQVMAVWAPAPGSHTGTCECQSHVCKEVTKCDITVKFTFAVKAPYAGCVFDRAAGGAWGQTGYTTTVQGCGVYGASREVGWSATCDATAMGCTTTFAPYCSTCVGRQCP